MELTGCAVVVVAGGAGRRLGGVTKALLTLGGRTLLARVLDASAGAAVRVVVGPPQLAAELPPGVLLTREEPAGGGPVAAIEAGVRLLPSGAGTVAVLAGDLPFLTADALVRLAAHLQATGADVAVLQDDEGNPQWTVALWNRNALDHCLALLGDPYGQSLRNLVRPVRLAALTMPGNGGPQPWFDCDTDRDLDRAAEWISRGY